MTPTAEPVPVPLTSEHYAARMRRAVVEAERAGLSGLLATSRA